MVLDQAVLLEQRIRRVRFAALVHDLGKATTPHREWPGHKGHEERSVALIEALCDRLKLPGEYRELSIIVARYHGNVHRAFELRPDTILGILEKTDAFRRPGRFAQALLACEADSRGRLGLEKNPYPQRRISAGGARRGSHDQAHAGGNRRSGGATDCGTHPPTPAERHHRINCSHPATQRCLTPYRDRSVRTDRATRSRCAALPAGWRFPIWMIRRQRLNVVNIDGRAGDRPGIPSAAISAVSATMGPREVLTKRALRFISASSAGADESASALAQHQMNRDDVGTGAAVLLLIPAPHRLRRLSRR